MPRVDMSAEEYRLLGELVQAHCGLTFGEGMLHLVQRRLAPRVQLHGLADFTAYYRFLRFDPGRRAELEIAAECLTTNETYFFREPHQLRAFADEILPALAAEADGRRRLRVWSAGCSTGEEVYTIAILLERSGLFAGWDVEVLGTDIARHVLAVARAGVYGPNAFRTPEAEEARALLKQEGGRWHVQEPLRRLTSFGRLNLLDENAARGLGGLGGFDVVFCRNVMIYFDQEARRRVVRTFHDRLREGGWLLLGHSESLLHVSSEFELVQLEHDLVYRKPRGAA